MQSQFSHFDAHCHIQESEFDIDREAVITQMASNSVGGIVVGTDRERSEKAIALALQYPFLFAAVGVHPTDSVVQTFDQKVFDELAASSKVVAIGECGLDYYRMTTDTASERTRQRNLFEGHIDCAVKAGKPLMIHCRAAHEDMIDIITSKKKIYGDKLQGNIHFFTAPLEIAQAYFNVNFSVSFSGVITFAHDYDDVVREAPEHLILSETDSPFASPKPYRGLRNEPVRVIEVVRRIAELRGRPFDEMSQILAQNARKIFSLSGV